MEMRREIYCNSLSLCTTRPQINMRYKVGADYEFSEAGIEMVHLVCNIVEFAFLLTFVFEKKVIGCYCTALFAVYIKLGLSWG